MNPFPLAPFLESLGRKGIQSSLRDYQRISIALKTGESWNILRLRGVLLALLVQNEEEEKTFLRCFDEFFATEKKERFPAEDIDVEKVLTELKGLQQENLLAEKTQSKKKKKKVSSEKSSVPNNTSKFRSKSRREEKKEEEKKEEEEKEEEEKEEEKKEEEKKEEEKKEEEKPHWDPTKSRYFRQGKIGGKPASRLSEENLSQLADSLGYFQSEKVGKSLDIEASIKATGELGGIPRLIFNKRKINRKVIILEDAFCEALKWNPIAGELAEGLKQRGVPLIQGKFYGNPENFQSSEGINYQLEDLEDQKNAYLLLLFSDGKSFRKNRDSFVLETLSRWPLVGWMELREKKFWDEHSFLPLEFDIPLYPATSDGLLRVVGRFLTEKGVAGEFLREKPHLYNTIPLGSLQLPQVEIILGDSLPWISACSMFQPITQGLADSLRRQFFPHLPAERIERIFQLPGTLETAGGILFSQRILSILRTSFSLRLEEIKQEDILRFLIKQIREWEPEDKNSPEYLNWELILEKVRLELEPDRALKRLAELAETPLFKSIQEDFENTSLSPDSSKASDYQKIPLRAPPKTKKGILRLAKIVRTPKLNRDTGFLLVMAQVEKNPVSAVLRFSQEDENILGKTGKEIKLLEGEWLIEAQASGYKIFQKKVNIFSGKKQQITLELQPLHTISPIPTPKTPSDLPETWVDPTTGMKFVLVKGGCYQMGDTFDEGSSDEKPVHEVCVDDFYLGQYVVTQGEWIKIMGENPSRFKGNEQLPVEMVSWEGTQDFIKKLNALEGSGKFRLPTEAEWEFAARERGKEVRFGNGKDIARASELNFNATEDWKEVYSEIGEYREKTVKVGSFPPNALGLYDMSGNVWEWVQDWYDEKYYSNSPHENPVGPSSASNRVLRGGGFDYYASFVRSANRSGSAPSFRHGDVGFRLCRFFYP